MFPLISSVPSCEPEDLPCGQVAVTATAPGAFPGVLSPTFAVVVVPRFWLTNRMPPAIVGAVAGSIDTGRFAGFFFAGFFFAGFGARVAVGLMYLRAGAAFFVAAFILVAVFFLAKMHLGSRRMSTIAERNATGGGRYPGEAALVNPPRPRSAVRIGPRPSLRDVGSLERRRTHLPAP